MNSNRQIEVSARFKIISSQGAFDGSHVMSRKISFQYEFVLQSFGAMRNIFRKTLAAELQVIFFCPAGSEALWWEKLLHMACRDRDLFFVKQYFIDQR